MPTGGQVLPCGAFQPIPWLLSKSQEFCPPDFRDGDTDSGRVSAYSHTQEVAEPGFKPGLAVLELSSVLCPVSCACGKRCAVLQDRGLTGGSWSLKRFCPQIPGMLLW